MPSLCIDAIVNVTDRIRVFTLRDAMGDPLPVYSPGAHIDCEPDEIHVRSYSLIDWVDNTGARDHYTIAVQREDDGTGGSLAMHALSVGQSLNVTEPSNDFEMHSGAGPSGNGPVMLLAGGIGVTPLISMATRLAANQRPFSFHYCARNASDMGFREELLDAFPDQMALYFDDQAPIDLGKVMRAQAHDSQIYICGPRGMIDAARAAAVEAGIGESNIHVELFTSAQPGSDDAPFEVEVSDTGQVFAIPAGKTIVEVLEAEGIDLMYDCLRGDCGICQTDVISGVPDHRDVVLSDGDRASGKVMQICVSRAKSPRLVLDL